MAMWILLGIVVLGLALWVGRRRPPKNTHQDEPAFTHRSWSIEEREPRKSSEPAPTPPPANPAAALPVRDNWEAGFLINEDKQIAIELPAWIHYRDGEGQESRRDIVVKRLVEQREDGEAILAFCEARKANRTFVVGRILQFVDRQTGEVVAHVSDHLRAAYRESPKGRVEHALTEHAAEANVLAFIARADGAMRQKQRDAIVAYMLDLDPALAGCEADLVASLSGLRPDQTDYRKHIRAAKAKPEAERFALLSAAETLAATRTSKREFTDGALQVARQALGPPSPPKPRRTAAQLRQED